MLLLYFQILITPKVDCVNCHMHVAMDMMEEHEKVCMGGSSKLADTHQIARYIIALSKYFLGHSNC